MPWSVGDLYNPLRAPPRARQLGDLVVRPDGTGALEGSSELLTVTVGPLSVLFRAVVVGGSQIVEDQPAAARIGCGVITVRPGLMFPNPQSSVSAMGS